MIKPESRPAYAEPVAPRERIWPDAIVSPHATARRAPCLCLIAGAGLFLLSSARLAAQVVAPADSTRIPMLEHSFTAGSSDSVLVILERRGVYSAEVIGAPATPTFQPVRRYLWPALVVPVSGVQVGQPPRFEVQPGATGPHVVRVSDLPPGATAILRLYRDDVEARSRAKSRDRDFAVGLLLGGGMHSGYRLDPTGGADPAGGRDVDLCILAQSGGRFGACLGMARQSFPDADFTVTWFFVEPRVRLVSGRLFGDLSTDLGAGLRLGQAPETGPRHISPSLLAVGFNVTQHLSPDGRRRGWSLYAAWLHGRLGNVPETERRDSDRVTAGLTWVP
jgi:hypothetical protein